MGQLQKVRAQTDVVKTRPNSRKQQPLIPAATPCREFRNFRNNLELWHFESMYRLFVRDVPIFPWISHISLHSPYIKGIFDHFYRKSKKIHESTSKSQISDRMPIFQLFMALKWSARSPLAHRPINELIPTHTQPPNLARSIVGQPCTLRTNNWYIA